MAQLIKTNGEITEIKPANGRNFQLSELQQMVGGTVDVVRLRTGLSMIVHDEGRLIPLPFNAEATKLYGFDSIHGDVVLCKLGEIR